MNKSSDKAYLTKRLLVRKSRKAIRDASSDALRIAGSIVKVEGNQVVRVFSDGRVQVITELDQSLNNQQLKLD